MKRILTAISICTFCIFLANYVYAFSYGLDDASTVTFTDNIFDITTGGEFKFTGSNGYEFITFCLEKSETIVERTTYNFSIDSYAVGGGINNDSSESNQDTLSDEAAWLYYQFSKGILADYDSTNRNDQSALQDALWFAEDEITNITGQADVFWNAAQAAVSGGWSNADYGVAVVNLTVNGVNKQSQLIAPVPEPTTMLLFGTGLLGLAGLGRKKLFRN